MNELIKLGILEFYQIVFIASIAYLVLNIFNLGFKVYGNLKLNNKAKYVLSLGEKFALLFALAIILSYII